MQTITEEQSKQISDLMKDFIEQTINLYDTLPMRPAFYPVSQKTLEHLGKLPIPKQERPLPEVFREMLQDIYASTLFAQHPRSFSCIPSTASLLSWLGDVMTSAYNPHAGCQVNAPAAALIEKKLIRWMCDLAGYPEESGGLFVSGGSIANLTALTAARDAKLVFEERKNAIIYISDQTHSSVAKALHIIGFCKDQIHTIPTDRSFCMDLSALQAAITDDIMRGKKPFAVIASAGTTNTGSIDPIADIATLCRKHDMWLHVDGAFGASALLSKQQRKKLTGIELSDSVSWDAHKWMLQTYSCSVVLIRNQENLVRSFAAHPEYLKDAENTEGSAEFWDLGPELTRPARSLKLWLTLQAMGSEKMGYMIDHGCTMAKLAEDIIRKSPGWEIISPAQLGIVNFRYAPDQAMPENALNQLNQDISKKINESGFAQVFTTQLLGKTVLRMCTINPETTKQDIHDTVARLVRIGHACTMPFTLSA